MKQVKVIDSHTGGEPTRVVIEGGPKLGSGPLDERVEIFREQFDQIRSAIVNEPRGSDVMVGGLLCEPADSANVAGVIFFTTVGYLGMCGHGTIGLVTTLNYLGLLDVGQHKIETPVGLIGVELHENRMVSVQNVASFRLAKDVTVEVPGYGPISGDIAWGGNWFFLVKNCEEDLSLRNKKRLLDLTNRIRDALAAAAITGENEAYIDHIELFGAPIDSRNNSRNFVLCPGGDYDRSPCGTGTSAKLACLAADKILSPGETWRQESVVGSVFECFYELAENDRIVPTIRGQAYISAESTLVLDPNDPFCHGIPL